MSLRIIQTSDIHLGAPFLFLKDKSTLHGKRVISAFKRSIDYAIKSKADVFFIVGDLFHTPFPDKYVQQIVIDELTRLSESGISTLLLPGNHDHVEGGIFDDIKFLARLPDEVMLLDIKGIEGVKIEELGIRVYSQTVFENIFDFDILQDDLINIALIHASVDIGKGSERKISLERMKSWNFKYIALGDWHGFLEVDKNIYYSGSPEILNSDQDGAGFILDVLIEEKGVLVKKIKVGEIASVKLEIDISKFSSLDLLLSHLKEKGNDNTIANIELKGLRSLDLLLDIERFENYLEDFYYHLNIKDMTLFKLSDAELDDLSNDMLIGSYVEFLKTKKESGEISDAVYEQAIQVGVNLLKGNNAN